MFFFGSNDCILPTTDLALKIIQCFNGLWKFVLLIKVYVYYALQVLYRHDIFISFSAIDSYKASTQTNSAVVHIFQKKNSICAHRTSRKRQANKYTNNVYKAIRATYEPNGCNLARPSKSQSVTQSVQAEILCYSFYILLTISHSEGIYCELISRQCEKKNHKV